MVSDLPMAEQSPAPAAATPAAGIAELAAGPAGPGPEPRRPPRQWDPTRSEDWDSAGASQPCLTRIRRDLMAIFKDPSPGMVIVPEESDLTKIHALVTGPFDTPYEGGFFHFLIRCPPDYPISVPRVKLLTTGRGTVRFNPNFYKDGKVCLSILGTWAGPAWSPALSLSSLLISIQSLMCEKPYHNEPGFEVEHMPGDAKKYNLIIQHETVRVAVLDNIESGSDLRRFPALFSVMQETFVQFYQHYEEVCQTHAWMDGQPMADPFREERGMFQFGTLLQRLRQKKEELAEWFAKEELCDEEDTDDIENK